jgi:hypothetical protein
MDEKSGTKKGSEPRKDILGRSTRDKSRIPVYPDDILPTKKSGVLKDSSIAPPGYALSNKFWFDLPGSLDQEFLSLPECDLGKRFQSDLLTDLLAGTPTRFCGAETAENEEIA